MTKKPTHPTSPPRERAFLVGVELHGQENLLAIKDSLSELALLADTAGLNTVGELTQKLSHPNPETLIGSGKIDELRALAEETGTQVVIFDDELHPRHQRELERNLGPHIRVLDRTALILDIFAQHAHTSAGQLQVKLAQYEYYLPRLTGQWTHLARQAGGGGGRSGSVGGVGLRGPGETQLEVDRRTIRREITTLKSEIEKLRRHRMHYRSQRKHSHLPIIALIGYTNAGKSTLMNCVTHSNIYTADQLFATLDPTTRRVLLPGGQQALITDTVGFIQKLPATLVAAFQATLEEIATADLLLHVVDISHPNALNHTEAVYATLEEIKANQIPMLTALNKIDRLEDPSAARRAMDQFPSAVAISARTGEGVTDMLSMIAEILFKLLTPICVSIPYQQGQLISLFHEFGQVEKIRHGHKEVKISGRIPAWLSGQFQQCLITPNKMKQEEEANVPVDE